MGCQKALHNSKMPSVSSILTAVTGHHKVLEMHSIRMNLILAIFQCIIHGLLSTGFIMQELAELQFVCELDMARRDQIVKLQLQYMTQSYKETQ